MSSNIGKILSKAGTLIPSSTRTTKHPTTPVWEGPESSGPNGGVTQSLISKWLCCRERARLYLIEGLRPFDEFSNKLHYGQMWHCCEEEHGKPKLPTNLGWKAALVKYCKELCRQYPTQQSLVSHWYRICLIQFPEYIKYWEKHKEQVERTPLLQEQVFSIPYKLYSGRTVILRGKWDGVDLIGRGKGAGIWLFETKTKGDIKEGQLVRQLSYDLQVMLYMVALQEWQRLDDYGDPIRFSKAVDTPIHGARYNVIRRPLSGGKGNIVRHKAKTKKIDGVTVETAPEETLDHFYSRVAEYIQAEPESYFMRWDVTITPQDIAKFRHECLDPILEQLCDWWEIVKDPNGDPFRAASNFRMPYGTFSSIIEGTVGDLDHYLVDKSEVGLTRVSNLFPEL